LRGHFCVTLFGFVCWSSQAGTIKYRRLPMGRKERKLSDSGMPTVCTPGEYGPINRIMPLSELAQNQQTASCIPFKFRQLDSMAAKHPDHLCRRTVADLYQNQLRRRQVLVNEQFQERQSFQECSRRTRTQPESLPSPDTEILSESAAPSCPRPGTRPDRRP